MIELRTERLVLHPVDPAEAERIVARQPGPHDAWAPDFPFEGDVVAATMFLRATAAEGDQQPFGYYVITRGVDGQAIGGAGFVGRPVDGTVEIGYGLAASARGNGFAAEAVRALADLARDHDVAQLIADTDTDNVASQRTLEHAGFERVGAEGDLFSYRRRL